MPGSQPPRQRRRTGLGDQRADTLAVFTAACPPLPPPQRFLTFLLSLGSVRKMGHFHRSLSRGTQPSGPQFTEHLWSLLCRGLLSDTSCCTFHGGLPLPCISGSQTWSPVASFPVGLPQTLQLRFSGQVDWIHFLPL